MQKVIKTNITKAKTKNQPKMSIKCAIPKFQLVYDHKVGEEAI